MGQISNHNTSYDYERALTPELDIEIENPQHQLVEVGPTYPPLGFVAMLVLQNILQPFLVSTSLDDSAKAKRVYWNFQISILRKVNSFDLKDLDMTDYYITFGRDWLYALGCSSHLQELGHYCGGTAEDHPRLRS